MVITAEQRRALQRHLAALIEEQRALDSALERQKSPIISDRSLTSLFAELTELTNAFPGAVQPFVPTRYFSHSSSRRDEDFYDAAGVRAYLGNTIGKLKAILDSDNVTPVTQSRDFAYVSDTSLRDILQRDYQEIQRAYIAKSNKATIILCGGAIEALLLSALQSRADEARAASRRPKNDDLTRWDLADLIAVARELEVVSAGVERLATPVREYRNLIHPGNEIRNRLTFGEEEARIAIEVLHIVDRDLSR